MGAGAAADLATAPAHLLLRSLRASVDSPSGSYDPVGRRDWTSARPGLRRVLRAIQLRSSSGATGSPWVRGRCWEWTPGFTHTENIAVRRRLCDDQIAMAAGILDGQGAAGEGMKEARTRRAARLTGRVLWPSATCSSTAAATRSASISASRPSRMWAAGGARRPRATVLSAMRRTSGFGAVPVDSTPHSRAMLPPWRNSVAAPRTWCRLCRRVALRNARICHRHCSGSDRRARGRRGFAVAVQTRPLR